MDTSGHQINLVQKRKATDGTWRFYAVVRHGDKPDPRMVVIDGKPESSKAGGAFYLDYRADGKRVRKQVGKTSREALDGWQKATGISNGLIPADEVVEVSTNAKSLTVHQGIKKYLKDVAATKSVATHRSYTQCLVWAAQHITKALVSQIDRSDLMKLFQAGRKEILNQKTTNKQVTVFLAMVRSHDHDVKLKKGDWPKTENKPVEVYTPEQMEQFFAACNDDEWLLFQTFLHTGFRDQEVATLFDTDLLYQTNQIRVSAKPSLKFKPKSYETRSVRVNRTLLEKLKAKRKGSKSKLVFPAAQHPTRKSYGGGVDKNMLAHCKEIAFSAGLNCGHCTGTYTIKRSQVRKEVVPYSCSTHPRCEQWYLHKWRHTFASMQISVLGLKGLQKAMGHKDVETTSVYLHFIEDDNLQAKIEASPMGKLMSRG
jgi:integrase